MSSVLKRSNNPFSDGGVLYARHRPSYPESLADSLAALCDSRALALDVGCGTGQLSRLLADRFTQVIATDASQAQITEAVPHATIDYRCESAEHINITQSSANLIVAAQAAHWFDLQAFYREVLRVAAPNAVIALLAYSVLSIEGELDEIFQRFYWQDIQRFWPPERRHVETGYADFEFPFKEVLMPEVYIERDWNLMQFLGYVNTWSAIKNARSDGASSVLENFAIELTDAWGDPDQTRLVKWPIVGRVGFVSV